MTEQCGAFLHAALRYAELGYHVFPCVPGGKAPITERGFHDATIDAEAIEAWWSRHPRANIGIATAGLIIIDIDGEANPWLTDDPDRLLGLACGPLAITPRGGSHRFFRQPKGKAWRCTEGRLAFKVDTRAEGGYVVAPPSIVDGTGAYRWAPGHELDDPPERLPEPPQWLAELLDRVAANGAPGGRAGAATAESNPIPNGQRNATLTSLAGTMRRVGMSQSELSAALNQVNRDRCEPPLDPVEVDRIAANVARYEPDYGAVLLTENWGTEADSGVDISSLVSSPAVPEEISDNQEEGAIPSRLLRVPGFISAVMDHTLSTAPYPSEALAFTGALALQAFLAGRKIQDDSGIRTNLYLLALGFSGAGKEWPRLVNSEIISRAGFKEVVKNQIASGEGIEDQLNTSPCVLYQTDEIDSMLQSMTRAKDARYEAVLRTLLTLYTSARSVYPMRTKAGGIGGEIDQPCLVLLGTAIPNHYYESLNSRLLTNGFFARTIVVESGKRGAGRRAGDATPPESIVGVAKWWANFQSSDGNLQALHPRPRVVHTSREALEVLDEARREAERHYDQAEEARDPVATTVWSRLPEQAQKLALIYAASECHEEPIVTQAAAQWASEFMFCQSRRALWMAGQHVAEGPIDALCLAAVRRLRDEPGRQLAHSKLLKRLKIDAKTFADVIATLVQRGDVEAVFGEPPKHGGPGKKMYRLTANA